ncbi:MAG TPA: MCE family protein [Acidimicrobiales bacterium]|jgi:phospholipid/cholesterol/gamma-HCH transport system substrate-binding protein
MKKLRAVVVSLVVLFVLVFGTITLVRTANGDFSGDYALNGLFPRAGEGLVPGSAVVFRGVQVGRVSTVALAENEARIRVLIDPSFKVPASTTATVEPVNLFGAEQVSLSTPHSTEAGPYLAHGQTFAHTATSDELGDLFAAAAPLLNAINTNKLSTVLSTLAQASQGEGPSIAAGIRSGTQLAGLLDSTVNSQILALDSFAKFSQSIASDGADLNNLNAQVNAGLPAFNAEEADYEQLLNTLIPFSNQLASVLSTYHPDIATILTAGDNISRVLLAEPQTIGEVVNGAYHYFEKIAEGSKSLQVLPDGSTYAYFNTFVLFSDVNSLVCNLIAPSSGGLSFLAPLQQALAGAGTAFNCSSQISNFDQLQSASNAVTNSPSATAATQAAGTAAATQAYGIAGQPDTSKPASIGTLIQQLLSGPS